MSNLMTDIYYRCDSDGGSKNDWRSVGEGEYEDLFLREHKMYDRHIVYKAFADAITNGDVSIIRPFLTNPVSYSNYSLEPYSYTNEEDKQVDKEDFLNTLAKEIDCLYKAYPIVRASVIPVCLRPHHGNANVLVKLKGCPVERNLEIHIDTFLNCAYKIWISEHQDNY